MTRQPNYWFRRTFKPVGAVDAAGSAGIPSGIPSSSEPAAPTEPTDDWTDGYQAGLDGQSDFRRRSYSGEPRADWWRGYAAGRAERENTPPVLVRTIDQRLRDIRELLDRFTVDLRDQGMPLSVVAAAEAIRDHARVTEETALPVDVEWGSRGHRDHLKRIK